MKGYTNVSGDERLRLITTSAAMDAVNVEANIGKAYKYIGTTDTKYTSGRIYFVESGPDYLCFTANTAGSTISMAVSGTPTLGQNFSYSTDGTTWSIFTPGTTTVTLSSVSDKVYFKGNNPNGVNQSNSIYYYFVMSGSVAASGNIMSLIDNGVCTTTTIPNSYCFYMLFRKCKNLTTAPQLPATTLTTYCYGYMFRDCDSLTSAPSLPATTLSSYCYSNMFTGCISLTTPSALPATILATGCYDAMFCSCISLYVSDTSGSGYDKAWVIPTNEVASGDYEMQVVFYNCLGTRSTDSPNFNGIQKTYYTQNTPV